MILQREADDADGDHRHRDLQHVSLFVVETAREKAEKEAFHLGPKHEYGAEHRGGVQRDVEREILFYPHA